MSINCPRQQFSFESVLTCVGDPPHLAIKVAFEGLDEFEKEWQIKEFCTELIHAVKHPSEHLLRLDAHLSQLLPGILKQRPSPTAPEQTARDRMQASKASQILARFPKAPRELLTLPLSNSGLFAKGSAIWDGIKEGKWANKYLVPEARSLFQTPYGDDAESVMQLLKDMQDNAWDNLFVTSFIDTNNMIFMLKVADIGHQPDMVFALTFLSYVNLLGELVDVYEALVDAVKFGAKEPFEDPAPSVQALKAALFPAVPDDHEESLSVLKAFLWSAWQRSVMLYFYYVIGVQLWHESPSTWSSLLAIRGVRRLIELDASDYRGDSTDYLCNWAFELLRTNRTSVALDFRRMISLFDEHFQGLPGRCIKGSDLACRGDLPESCQRFTGAEAKSQSMHATTCDERSCTRIRWNETSYRECKNPRAVIANGDDDFLRYCEASSSTMSISHVWSRTYISEPVLPVWHSGGVANMFQKQEEDPFAYRTLFCIDFVSS